MQQAYDHSYDEIIERRADEVIDEMAQRVSLEDVTRLRMAFEFAREAHAMQLRKGGEPYIMHPISVARICAHDLRLDVNSVIAAFLHDVVEDTPHTNDEVKEMFGPDVAFLVRVVTKQKKDKYEMNKQLDNFKQMLQSIQYDIRAILIKLADRLHNMRTLASMRTDKQMKIAGETDYFYAPLATRLGLYPIKVELENLSFKFRCPHEYQQLVDLIEQDKHNNKAHVEAFCRRIHDVLTEKGYEVEVTAEWREPYSLWRKMGKYGDDFNHLKYRHIINVVYKQQPDITDKRQALRIYSLLTDTFDEKPTSIINYIDAPKENGYRSFHVKLLSDFGRWEEVHISSREMVRASQLGCVADRAGTNLHQWIEKFRNILRDIAADAQEQSQSFIDKVVQAFYNDDITVYTPTGKPVLLPQKATALDFAYEVHTEVGEHAHYARINGWLSSLRTVLRRGDIVEIFTSPDVSPEAEWLDSVITYKARRNIAQSLSKRPKLPYNRCNCCKPIPGEEVIGFVENDRSVTVHKRNCPDVIRLASQHGDNIVAVDYAPGETEYQVTIDIIAIDRNHLLADIIDGISKTQGLSIGAMSTTSGDSIVKCRMSFKVHSYEQLSSVMEHIKAIDGIDEVKEVL